MEQPPPPVQNLEDYIQGRSGTISEDDLRGILRQVTKIISNVHDAGVSHRDIKAENILIEVKTGKIYLIDFGCGTTVQPYIPKSTAGKWQDQYMFDKII